MKNHVGSFIEEELEHRNWSTQECAAKACVGREACSTFDSSLNILLAAAKAPEGDMLREIRLDDNTADGLAKAFGTSRKYWLNIDRAFHESNT